MIDGNTTAEASLLPARYVPLQNAMAEHDINNPTLTMKNAAPFLPLESGMAKSFAMDGFAGKTQA